MLLREIKTHAIGILNEKLILEADQDSVSTGGAPTTYYVTLDNPRSLARIKFQDGNPAESVNGLSNEVLLAIVADRLEKFQQGPYGCKENGDALGFIVLAMDALQLRTGARFLRGVEGKAIP